MIADISPTERLALRRADTLSRRNDVLETSVRRLVVAHNQGHGQPCLCERWQGCPPDHPKDERTMTQPTFLTPEQAAECMGISINHMYAHLRRGTIPGVKLGKIWRINRATIEALGTPAATATPTTPSARRW